MGDGEREKKTFFLYKSLKSEGHGDAGGCFMTSFTFVFGGVRGVRWALV